MAIKKPNNFFLILILGSLTALSPFSIDMYLPAFPQIALDFGTTVSKVALSLSSYFVGLSIGQLFYGPLLDRFGRKKPLYFGLSLFMLASIACVFTTTTEGLVFVRFIQAIGGCAAGVGSMSMVRDLFSVKESSKVLSLLILVLGASPMVAPTVGGFVTVNYGWHSVFWILALLALTLFGVVRFFLPETHKPDTSVSLRFKPILKNYLEILKYPQFYTYVFTGALAFAGLFVYVASSPIIFMNIFKVEPQTYSWIFAGLSVGFIGASQLNILMLKYFKNGQILTGAILVQTFVGSLFFVGTYLGWFALPGTIAILFSSLACVGLANPNGASLALAPFTKNTGSAAALMGFLQMAIGAAATAVVGFLDGDSMIPITVIFAVSSAMAVTVLTLGRRRISHEVTGDHDVVVAH